MLELRGKARRLAARRPDLAMIVVDYLQLLSGQGKQENRNQEVSQITRSLKLLAGELQVPILALSQLSRDLEKRHDKRPMLSDLRDSGSIEQDSDLVILIYRDSYYNPEDARLDGTEGVCEVNLAKQRNGPTDTVKLAFTDRWAKFANLDHRPSV
jgi:replicative DNA helicase